MQIRRLYNLPQQKIRRQLARNSARPAEIALWRRLQGGQLQGMEFLRQHDVGDCIVDFYCPEQSLVVELQDVVPPYASDKAEALWREQYLASLGLLVLHIKSRDVLRHMDDVLKKITTSFE